MIVVVGNFAWDITHHVDRLPNAGETVLARKDAPTPGGKGLNQAAAAARQGARVRLHAPIGAGDIEAVKLALAPLTDLALFPWPVKGGSDQSLILLDAAGENAIVSTHAAASSVGADAARAAGSALNADGFLLAQGNLGEAATHAAFEVARERGARVVYNPAPFTAAAARVICNADFVVLNECEAKHLAATGADMRGDAVKITTLGALGARVETANSVAMVPTTRVTPIDTAGAGDAFVGTLVAALTRGASLLDAVERANAFAAKVTTRPGTFAAIVAT